jgi:hypothetical protein
MEPVINEMVNQKLNALLDEFLKEYPDHEEIINKERYPIKIHIKDNSKRVKPELQSPKVYVQRGRKKNNAVTLADLDITKYVQAVVITINEEQYFMDQNNLLFKYNNVNEIVGHIVNQEVQWF